MRKLLFSVLLCCWGLAALGQAPQRDSTRTGARVETAYFDTQDKELPSAEGASYRVETAYVDSVRGSVRVFYPSGKLKSYTGYAHLRRHLKHGRSLGYYESGQLHWQDDVIANKRQGDFLVYYPDGKLRRRDHYEAGQRTTGECFGPDEQPITYFEYEQMPMYPEGDGGMRAVVTAIQQRVRYPISALQQHITGTVKVKFTVDATGQVKDVGIADGVDESKFHGAALAAVRELEATVMQAVRDLKRFRPGQQDGANVAVRFTAPITFKIQ